MPESRRESSRAVVHPVRHSRGVQRPARHVRRAGAGRRVARVAAVTAGVLALSGTTGAAALYAQVQGSIEAADVDQYLGDDRPEAVEPDPVDGYAGRPLNILVMGTDVRDGENAALAGETDGMRSDTTLLVHLSADRSRVDVVSVPRDSLVDIPSCTLEDGSTTAPRSDVMFNDAFHIGGGDTENLAAAAACTRLTFEQATGLRTDESVVVKMDGVRDVIDALGGVPMDLPEAMDSPKAGLHVPAGPQTFDGTTALQFLRARTGTGNGLEMGSDLARIERQQQLIDALAAQVQSTDLLTSPGTLMPVLTSVTRSLSISEGLADVRDLAGLALTLRDVDPATLQPVTVPVTEAPQDRNRVVWTAAAQDLWDRLAADRPLTGAADGPTAGATGATGA
ncbi:LCP family protein [Cellulomonas pakistanensis]|uniref:Transcriptional regulator n=1 Tax=Cellulomonas pakistanensis TaxID=992287 RepID=A0A919U410_9CELL|nr:LCP family protein [Cellulomonas pakistanensis]GIG37853.1 transcriptional regulator [Cellulomonas pakistanensis]